MPKRPGPLPDRSGIDDDTPLHLATAARLAFPDGVVSGLALRNAAYRGDLEYERLGGRLVTTLRWIREWRERNRYPARPRPETSEAGIVEDRNASSAKLAAQQTLARLSKETKATKSARQGKAIKGQK